MEKYEKVLNLMKTRGGRVELSDPDLLAILNRDAKSKKNLVYRISAYMWSIRHVAKLEVRGVRQGRKVVAYELVSMTPATTSDEAPAETPVSSDSTPDIPGDGTVIEA